MYFDNLTIISLLAFFTAFGRFAYGCIIRGCITDSAEPRLYKRVTSGRHHPSSR